MYVCTYVGTYICMCVCMDVCMDVWMSGCMDVWMYGCMDVWMYGFYVFSAPGGPKVRTRPKRGLKQNENSCFEHFLGVGIFRIFSGPGGVDFAKSALFASRGPQTS